LLRVALLLAGLDSLAAGAWAALRPADVFASFQLPPSPDSLLLARALGGLLVFQAGCLLLAARRPADCGGLVLLPLAGRLLQCGVWLWLLGTDRVSLPPAPLRLLLLHDAVWLPLFLAFLWARPRPHPKEE
jgi:hypothetical protein